MTDYPLLSVSQIARVNSIDFFGGGRRGIISLDVRGQDFSGTTAVLINGTRSPTFVVISDVRILVDLPRRVLGESIRTLNVLKASTFSGQQGSVISFEAVNDAVTVPDSTFLVQKVLKFLFTTKGSDIFNPSIGGDLLTLMGTNQTSEGTLASYAKLYIRESVSSLIKIQAGSTAPRSQKVQSVEVLSASYSRQDTSLDIRLAITSLEGQRVVAGLSV
jgi:hypothetical protein